MRHDSGVNGRVAHGLFFVTLLQDSRWFERFGVKDFEVVQREIDSIDLNLVCQIEPDIKDRDKFVNLCVEHFGHMRIELNFVNEISRTQAGKRRYTRYEVR